MASSRPKQPEPRPAPRLMLITPAVADADAFMPTLAAGLTVVNIDNGFGAGVFATRVARRAHPAGAAQ